MTDEDVWALIESVREKVGMSLTNFRKQKSENKLAEKWPALIYLALEEKKQQTSLLRRLQALSN